MLARTLVQKVQAIPAHINLFHQSIVCRLRSRRSPQCLSPLVRKLARTQTQRVQAINAAYQTYSRSGIPPIMASFPPTKGSASRPVIVPAVPVRTIAERGVIVGGLHRPSLVAQRPSKCTFPKVVRPAPCNVAQPSYP